MKLLLVRHGKTKWNIAGLSQGQADLELDEEGRREARAVALALRDEDIKLIYSSPLSRALKTAEEINRFHRVEIRILEELKELDIGVFDGLSVDEIKRRYGEEMRRFWEGGDYTVRIPGGESLQELYDRARRGLDRILGETCGLEGAVAVVGHFFCLRMVICALLGLDISCFRRIWLNEGSLSIFEISPGRAPRLLLLNDLCHLSHER